MKILFINQDEKNNDIYKKSLEGAIDSLEIDEATSFLMATISLEKIVYDAVVWKDDNHSDPAVFFDALKEKSPKTMFIIYGERPPKEFENLKEFKTSNINNSYIKSPLSPRDFCLKFIDIMDPKRGIEQNCSAFYKVRLEACYRYNFTYAPLFIKLSDSKYVKVFHGMTNFNSEDLDKFAKKGIENFFVANRDLEEFKDSHDEYPFLERLGNCDTFEDLALTNKVLHSMIISLGVTDEALNMATNCIEGIKRIIAKTPKLSTIIKAKKNRDGYLYDHSHLVALVGCDLLMRLHWDSEENIQRVCEAAVFHDMALDSNILAMINNINDPALLEFSKDDIEKYKKHPDVIADYLESVPEISDETIHMIRYHHELNDGTGPHHLHPSHLSELSALFIVAHRFVHMMYQNDFEIDKHGIILELLKAEYSDSVFQTALMAFDLPCLNLAA